MMHQPNLLGYLSQIHEFLYDLIEATDEKSASVQFYPDLGSLKWLFGRSVYLELFWLREKRTGDDDLSRRVEHLFNSSQLTLKEQCDALPPKDHLLNWASEIHSEHLRQLANPEQSTEKSASMDQRIVWYLIQEQALLYEAMLMVLNQARLVQTRADAYTPRERLVEQSPETQTKEISQGHFRIGARNDPSARDNELPAQAVELSSFRIAITPVSNGQYLAFINDGGYTASEFWTDSGWEWLNSNAVTGPSYWLQNSQGDWYAVGLGGPYDLVAHQPVSGISHHEATAYARWADSKGGDLSGAVVQHEYQWEVAARMGSLQQIGEVREWCANEYHHYPEYMPYPETNSDQRVQKNHYPLRGGSLHAQKVLKRLTFRYCYDVSERHHLNGVRLVFPAQFRWT